MTKKFLLAGIVVAAGFVTLTAFGGQTLEQQKADIQKAITAKLEAYRSDKAKECDARVETEAKARFDKAMAEKANEKAPAPAPKKTTPKKATAKGPKAPALPQAPPPADPAQAKKDKTAGNAPVNTDAKKSKTAGELPPPNTNAKKAKTAGNPPAGGN